MNLLVILCVLWRADQVMDSTMTPDGERTPSGDEAEDDDFDDLYNQINYNTITSLAALKEILGNDSNTSADDNSWFQHYFLTHVNRLPSRNQYPGRRLSECPEEDESATETSAEQASTKHTPKHEVTKVETPTQSAPPTPKRNPSLTPDTPPPSPKMLSRGTSPHLDKRFFDVSLIEMKSQASSTSTLDYDSTDEVWIRRTDAENMKRKKVSPLLFVLSVGVSSYLSS